MLRRFCILTGIFFSIIYSGHEIPRYTVIQDVLSEDEMAQLHTLTIDSKGEQLWYGRRNFWRETFEARIDKESKEPIFTHDKEYKSNAATNTLSALLLLEAQKFGANLASKRIVLESYYDRNTVNKENADSSGLFWHRDITAVDGNNEISDFTLILLANGKEQNWKGADIVLQQGGEYKDDSSYSWVNSDNPEVTITPRYNQVIIFRNSDTGHKATPLIPLSDETVNRDVFIITCYIR